MHRVGKTGTHAARTPRHALLREMSTNTTTDFPEEERHVGCDGTWNQAASEERPVPFPFGETGSRGATAICMYATYLARHAGQADKMRIA